MHPPTSSEKSKIDPFQIMYGRKQYVNTAVSLFWSAVGLLLSATTFYAIAKAEEWLGI